MRVQSGWTAETVDVTNLPVEDAVELVNQKLKQHRLIVRGKAATVSKLENSDLYNTAVDELQKAMNILNEWVRAADYLGRTEDTVEADKESE